MYGLKKVPNGFLILDQNGAPMDSILVGDLWMAKHDPYMIDITSFDPGRETFVCTVIDSRTGGKWSSSIQDAMHFYTNYRKTKTSQLMGAMGVVHNTSPHCRSITMPSPMHDANYKITIVNKESKCECECGGHKAGFKDYTRQHSSWCPVYKE